MLKMCDDSDQDISELDIESRTWNKLEKNMELIGFLEGATKGKDLSMQEGFNLGYSDGFQLGLNLGTVKGIQNCESKLNLSAGERFHFNEKDLSSLSNQACVLCSKEKGFNESASERTAFEKFEDLIQTQQSHNNEVLKILKQSDWTSHLDKG